MIRLESVDPSNWRLGLTVTDDQKTFVANNYEMLARAFAYRDFRSQAYVIFDGETPVGMVMYYDCDDLNAYDLSQLFIDKRYHGHGYGKAATQLVLDLMKQDGKFSKVILCYIEGNEAAKMLYEGFGFTVTDQDEDEIIMELPL